MTNADIETMPPQTDAAPAPDGDAETADGRSYRQRIFDAFEDNEGQAAQRTARVLVVYHRRAGGQSQHSAMLQLDAKSDRVQIALAFAKQNLRKPLTVELLADAARLSPRQFSRVFRAETGLSPAKAIENLRLEAARFMLEQGRLPIEEIARECRICRRR
jgi:transcriptional regulator GlxA family with amidase domain